MQVLCCRSVAVQSCVAFSSFPCQELEPPLQQFEPRIGHTHTTQRRIGFTVFALAVPVRPPTDPESQPLGDAHESLLDGWGMTGMPDLDAVQSLVLKDAELGLCAVITQMRRHGQPSHLV